jgi:hypothetical protein
MDRSYCAQFVKFIRERFSYSRISKTPANDSAVSIVPALSVLRLDAAASVKFVHRV